MVTEMRYPEVEQKPVGSMAERDKTRSPIRPDREEARSRMLTPWMLSIMMVTLITGCSTTPIPVQPIDSMQVAASPSTPSDPEFAVSSQHDRVGALSSAGSDRNEFSDPFAQPGEITVGEEDDLWEPFNIAMFEFNRRVDKYALKPVADAYDFILPDAVQVGIGNFFHNIRFVPRLLNNVFQAKAKGAGIELGRFLINTTVGVAGFFDPAKHWWHLETPDEDSGQTFGFYGMKQGPYLVLPFFPPLTLRDGIGYVADLALDPVTWLVFAVTPGGSRTTYTLGQFGARVGDTVNERSLNLETFQGVEDTTVDLYEAVRNAYLQKRAKAVRE